MTADTPPLVLDIDGTLTRPDKSLDPRVVAPIRSWPAPVVVATGQVLPYAAALTRYLGIERRAIGENGGTVMVDGEMMLLGDATINESLSTDWQNRGGRTDRPVSNRWRETELAVVLDGSDDHKQLRSLAAAHGLELLDAEYSHHVCSPNVSKGAALTVVCERLSLDPEAFVAVGDACNDISTFEAVGEAYAVANAAPAVQAAADHVTDGSYADGVLEVLETVG